MNTSDTTPFIQAVSALGAEAQRLFVSVGEQEMALACEIRLRVGARVILSLPDGLHTVGTSPVTRSQMEKMVLCLCDHSIYTHQHEIASGFIALPGGHRAGVCGTAVVSDGSVSAVRDITTVCLRIAREHRGCADELTSGLFADGLCSAVIAGAPGPGKTTLLRDAACSLAERGLRVAMIDERGELAPSGNGIADRLCDVLRGYPKAEGIMTALRSLSPDVMLCDELGGEKDIEAVRAGVNAGVHMLCSLHAGNRFELARRRLTAELINTGAFSRFAVLEGRSSPGKTAQILRTEDIYALSGGGFDGLLRMDDGTACPGTAVQKKAPA